MIAAVNQHNLSDVLPLVRAYQTFYQVANTCDDKNKSFLAQFSEESQLGCQFLYIKEEKAVAFATVYFSFSTTIAAKVAVLNDLYTLPEYRGEGIAIELIEHCQKFAKEKGAVRLQWVTAPDNKQAQKLYDKLGTKKSSWYFYTL